MTTYVIWLKSVEAVGCLDSGKIDIIRKKKCFGWKIRKKLHTFILSYTPYYDKYGK